MLLLLHLHPQRPSPSLPSRQRRGSLAKVPSSRTTAALPSRTRGRDLWAAEECACGESPWSGCGQEMRAKGLGMEMRLFVADMAVVVVVAAP